MSRRWTGFWLLLTLVLQVAAGNARGAEPRPVVLGEIGGAPIGHSLFWLQEKRPMTLEEAREAFEAGQFRPSRRSVLDFGIGAPPVWLLFDVHNGEADSLQRQLVLKASWIDRVEVHFLSPSGNDSLVRLGDAYPFGQRPVKSRYLLVEHGFPPGRTRVMIRVETSDPMLLPLYLLTRDQVSASEVAEGHGYGLLYGGIVILIAYNFMLFLGLKSWRYLFYSAYLGTFLLMNMAYTGHGYQWFWPRWPTVQYWSNPVLILSFGLAGLIFALRFLELYRTFPRLHRAVLLLCVLFAFLGMLAIALQERSVALVVSFVSVLLLSVLMPLLGGISFFSGNRSAKYFLLGSLTHATGGSITALTVWGCFPTPPISTMRWKRACSSMQYSWRWPSPTSTGCCRRNG